MCYYKNVAKPFLIGCGVAYSYMFGLSAMWSSGLGPMTLGENLGKKLGRKINPKKKND
jgi:hypothetical protein